MDAIAAISILAIVAIVIVVYVTLFQRGSGIGSRKVVIVKKAPIDPWALSWQPWYRVGPYGGPLGYRG